MISRGQAVCPPSSREIARWLDRELGVAKISDSALNGLQVESRRPVHKIAAAVDASLASFDAAARAGADLLLVHHGLFWGPDQPMTPTLHRRIRTLVDYGLSLYASHLPLDLHPRLGNNACLARALGLQELKPFGLYHGQTIGCGGKLLRGMNLRQLQQKFSKVLGRNPQAYHFGNPRIRRVAIVSGNASDLAVEAADQGYDAFITGELGHSAYHVCKEAGINILAGGHYATETFGVKILAQALGKKYSIPSVFLDIPTGL